MRRCFGSCPERTSKQHHHGNRGNTYVFRTNRFGWHGSIPELAPPKVCIFFLQETEFITRRLSQVLSLALGKRQSSQEPKARQACSLHLVRTHHCNVVVLLYKVGGVVSLRQANGETIKWLGCNFVSISRTAGAWHQPTITKQTVLLLIKVTVKKYTFCQWNRSDVKRQLASKRFLSDDVIMFFSSSPPRKTLALVENSTMLLYSSALAALLLTGN